MTAGGGYVLVVSEPALPCMQMVTYTMHIHVQLMRIDV